MAMIEAFGLTRKFNGLIAVEDLSLEIGEGEVLAFFRTQWRREDNDYPHAFGHYFCHFGLRRGSRLSYR
jgi:hypothetical protein